MAKTRRAVDVVNVGGIQISIDYSWLIIFFLVLWSLAMGYFPSQYPGRAAASYWLVGATATVFFFASVLIHELSHALVANRVGQEVKRITLFVFGGMAHLSGEPDSPRDETKIAAIGPLTSLALGALFWGIASATAGANFDSLWSAMFSYLAFINVALAIFNLLPGYPLDGGRLLRAAFWRRSGDLRAATARAADWGGGIALGLMVLGALQIFAGALIGGMWLIFIGMFLRGAARASYYGLVLEHALGKMQVSNIMVADPIAIPPESSVAQAIDDYFLRHGHTGFPVASNHRPMGLLTLAAVRDCPAEERAQKQVREIMRPADGDVPITIGPEASAADALRRMSEPGIGRLLVVEDGRLVGLVTRSTIARFAQMRTALDARAGGEWSDDALEPAA